VGYSETIELLDIFDLVIMFAYLRYKLELRRLNKFGSNLSKQRKEFEDSDEVCGPERYPDLQPILDKEWELESWIDFHQTKYYESICREMIIPMPEKNDQKLYYKFNFDDDAGDRYILTTAGFHEVRNSIRDEKKRKREAVGFWITMLTGVIGALIGLVSVL